MNQIIREGSVRTTCNIANAAVSSLMLGIWKVISVAKDFESPFSPGMLSPMCSSFQSRKEKEAENKGFEN